MAAVLSGLRKNGAITTPAYPAPDRSNYILNVTATGNHPTIDRRWGTGTFKDGRPFCVDVWSEADVWMFEFQFSIIGIETLTTESLVRLLEQDGLITIGRHDHRFASAMVRDARGNDMHIVGSVTADARGTCVALHVRLRPYELPADAAAPRPELIRGREGRVSADEMWRLRRTGEAERSHRGMDVQLVCELARLAPPYGAGARLSVRAGAARAGTFDVHVHGLDGYPLVRGPDMPLRVAVARMYEWMEESQGVAWTSLNLAITRLESRNFRYEIQFGYASQA
jgi:hypothetical protein